MPKPFLIIVNGPPSSGKTTISNRLSMDLGVPVIHRDNVAETLFDGLDCQTTGRPSLIGSASFKLTYYFASIILDAGQSLILEASFHNPERAKEELFQLKQEHDFEPLQIQCRADGKILLERFLSRANTGERHPYHRDIEFAEHNSHLLLMGRYPDFPFKGQVIEVDTTDIRNYDYEGLLQKLQAIIQ